MNTTLVLEEAIPPTTEVVPLTVDQYHRMLETGILAEDDPIELLNGLLVRKDRGEEMSVKPLHASTMSRVLTVVPALSDCHLRVQDPVTIHPSHEPEPDAAIVRGRPQDYTDHHPGPEDVVSLVEISESSLEHDRTTKLRIYAAAGIPQYVILNLIDRRVEVYEDPDAAGRRFRTVQLLTGEDPIPLRVSPSGERLELAASEWLS